MARRNKLNTPEKRARIGERIKVAAAQAGLTLKELAEKTGTSPSFIYQYVRGITGIPAPILEQVALITHVPIDFFDPDRDARSALALAGETNLLEAGSPTLESQEPDTWSRVRGEIRNLEVLAAAYDHVGRNPAAYFSTIEQRLALTRALQDRVREALLLEEMGQAKRQNQQFEDASRNLMAACDIFTAQGMDIERTRVTAALADLLIDTGQFDAARALLGDVLNSPDMPGIAMPLLAMSRLHHREQRYHEALRCVCQAASKASVRADRNLHGGESVAKYRGPLTDIAVSTGRFDSVLALWTMGLKHAVSGQDAELFVEALLHLGRSAFALGRLGQARERLENAVFSGMLLEDNERTSIAHALLARVQLSLGASEAARDNARAAHRLASRHQGALPMILASLAKAECSLAFGRWHDALDYGQDATQEAARVGRKEECSRAHEVRARAYLGLFQDKDGQAEASTGKSLLELAFVEAAAAVDAAGEAQSLQDRVAARLTLANCFAKAGDDIAMEREARAAVELSGSEDAGQLTQLIEQEADMIPAILCSPELNLTRLFTREKTRLPELEWQAHTLIASALLRRSGPEAAFPSFKSAAESLILLLEELTPSQIVSFQDYHTAARTVFEETVRCAVTDEAVEETTRLLSSAPWLGNDTLIAVVGSRTSHAPPMTVSSKGS